MLQYTRLYSNFTVKINFGTMKGMIATINWRRVRGISVIAVLIIIPIVLWLGGAGLGAVFYSPSASIKALGKAAAFAAIVTYSLLPILSVRYPLIMRIFGGLDVAFSLHKKVGRIVAFFILAHPLFLIIGGIMQGWSLFTVWNWDSSLILTGVFAVICFGIIFAITLYSNVAHKQWIMIHRLFGWLLPIFMIHALLARSQMVQNRVLFYYIWALVLCGFAAFLYRSVFAALFVKKYHYEVADVNHINNTVTELVLRPVGIPMNYIPGQFAYLSLSSDAVDNEPHPFSFTTSDNGPYIRFVIKALGDYTTNIRFVQPGEKASLEGPYGDFSYHNSKNKQQVWIAGGVGITPFLSMARSLSNTSDYRITLFYAAEGLDDAVFLHELIKIRKLIPDVLSLVVVDNKTSGFVTIDMIKKEVGTLPERDYFICGPPVMSAKLKSGLKAADVASTQMHIEEFSMR